MSDERMQLKKYGLYNSCWEALIQSASAGDSNPAFWKSDESRTWREKNELLTTTQQCRTNKTDFTNILWIENFCPTHPEAYQHQQLRTRATQDLGCPNSLDAANWQIVLPCFAMFIPYVTPPLEVMCRKVNYDPEETITYSACLLCASVAYVWQLIYIMKP